MNKEEVVALIKEADSERKAEYMQKLIKIEVQTAFNLSNDRRLISVTPFLIDIKKAKVEAMTHVFDKKIEKLDEIIKAMADAFGIIQNTTRAAVVSPLLLIFWGIVLADLLAKQVIFTADVLDLQERLLTEIDKDLADYYFELPPIDP